MGKLFTPKNLSKWLKSPKGQVGYYVSKAEHLMKLNRLWKQQKDVPLVLHSTIANWEEDTLVIAISRSEWATQLHYAQFDLMDRLKMWPGLATLNRIKWYVQSPVYSPQDSVTPPNVATLSQENKQLIESVANTLSSPLLKAALRQLAA